MVFCCGLKLATRSAGLRSSQEELLCRPRSATECDWTVATWYELQNDLNLVAVSAGPGGGCEQSLCELKPAVTSTRPWAAQQNSRES